MEPLVGPRRGGGVVPVELGTADGQDVRARGHVQGDEDLLVGRVRRAGVAEADHAVVPRAHHRRDALEGELHQLAALALYVVVREAWLVPGVGDGYYVRGLVDAALELALVPPVVGVRVDGVAALCSCAVTCLAERAVGTVAAVDGVEECCFRNKGSARALGDSHPGISRTLVTHCSRTHRSLRYTRSTGHLLGKAQSFAAR